MSHWEDFDWTKGCSAYLFIDSSMRSDCVYYVVADAEAGNYVPVLYGDRLIYGSANDFYMMAWSPGCLVRYNSFYCGDAQRQRIWFRTNNLHYVVRLLEDSKFLKSNTDPGTIRDILGT